MAPAAERLQKRLAALGLGSRRQVERWIRAGRVIVDGEVAQLGQKITGSEEVLLDGQPLAVTSSSPARPPRVILYHKPVGEICTRDDPEGRPTVFDGLPPLDGARWVSVGRLDLNTSGLLLFTNDGELANRLMHPSAGFIREYRVRVLGEPSRQSLKRLSSGIQLDDGPAQFSLLQSAGGEGANRWFRVGVADGRNRVVRRLWESQGHQVSRLIRVRMGPVALPRDLPVGEYRDLTPAEIRELTGVGDSGAK